MTWRETPAIALIAPATDIAAFAVAHKLRRAGVATATFFSGNAKRQMTKAHQIGAAYALIRVGEGFRVRDMELGVEQDADASDPVGTVIACLIYDGEWLA